MRDQRQTAARAVVSLDRAQLVGLGFFAVLSGGLMFGLGYASGKTRKPMDPQPPVAVGIAKVEQNHARHEELQQEHVDLTFYKALVEKDKEPKAQAQKQEVAKLDPVKEPIKPEPLKIEPQKPIEKPEPMLTSTLPVAPAPQPMNLTAEEISEPKAPAPSAAASGVPWTIQVSAFKTEGEALSFTKLLQAKGFKPQVVTATIPNQGTWYRVRIGKFSTREAAETYQQRLARENIPTLLKKID